MPTNDRGASFADVVNGGVCLFLFYGFHSKILLMDLLCCLRQLVRRSAAGSDRGRLPGGDDCHPAAPRPYRQLSPEAGENFSVGRTPKPFLGGGRVLLIEILSARIAR